VASNRKRHEDHAGPPSKLTGLGRAVARRIDPSRVRAANLARDRIGGQGGRERSSPVLELLERSDIGRGNASMRAGLSSERNL
jgi:hypothetical protein